METPVPLKDLTFDHRDEFDRKSIAEKVIKLLDAEMDFCPMAIDGGWGTGKTEFCHKLINLIKEQDAQRQKAAREAAAGAVRAAENAEDTVDAVAQADTVARSATDGEQTAAQAKALPPERAVIYLDAFSSETVDDPLLCILAAIRAEFPDEETRKEIRQSAMAVMKVGGKIVLKGLAAHLLKQDGEGIWAELTDAAQDGANDLIDRTVDNLLDQYAHAQQNIEALQETIAKATAQRPILFFIDELDRCRPDFALSILELVKHVFDIPGIKFIFVANLEQLKAAIRKRYGQDVDADVYLEKFINLSIILPPVHNRTSINASYLLLKKEFSGMEIFDRDDSLYSEFMLHLIEKYSVNLRGIKKFIQNVKIYTTLNDNKCPLDPDFVSGYKIVFLLAIFIFTFDERLKNKYILGHVDREIFEFLGKSDDNILGCVLAVLGTLIYYGQEFSFEKVECPQNQKENIRIVMEFLRGNSLSMPPYSFREVMLKFVQTMNLLPISR